MDTKTKRASTLTPSIAEIRNFGVKDSKGREIGGRVTTWTAVTAEVPLTAEDLANGWHTSAGAPLGTSYVLRVHATRDGLGFGASHAAQYYATVAERDAAIETYFKNAAKRALKCSRS